MASEPISSGCESRPPRPGCPGWPPRRRRPSSHETDQAADGDGGRARRRPGQGRDSERARRRLPDRLTYQTTNRTEGTPEIQSRRQSRRCHRNSTPRPARKASATPEHPILANRHTHAPMSARLGLRSISTSAPSPPARVPRKPIWNGQRRSCHDGPSNIRRAGRAPAAIGWIFRRKRKKRRVPQPTSSRRTDDLVRAVMPQADDPQQHLVDRVRDHRRVPVVRLQDVGPVPGGGRQVDRNSTRQRRTSRHGPGSATTRWCTPPLQRRSTSRSSRCVTTPVQPVVAGSLSCSRWVIPRRVLLSESGSAVSQRTCRRLRATARNQVVHCSSVQTLSGVAHRALVCHANPWSVAARLSAARTGSRMHDARIVAEEVDDPLKNLIGWRDRYLVGHTEEVAHGHENSLTRFNVDDGSVRVPHRPWEQAQFDDVAPFVGSISHQLATASSVGERSGCPS